jgi:hypothetical protein
MTEEQTEQEEFRFTDGDAWEALQRENKCGEFQNNGRRCTNTITEWFVLDEDRPDTSPKVGSCGMHLQIVASRIRQFKDRVYENRLDQYFEDEGWRIARAFDAMGLKIQRQGGGWRRSNFVFVLKNPAEFMDQLGQIGLPERMGIDINRPECGAKNPQRHLIESCRLYLGHEGMHHDLSAGSKWEEPEPEPEPEPPVNEAKETSNGQTFT